MGEFDQYDGQNNFNERRRRKNRRLNYEDDALGMADAGDRSDGDFANIEDYAGGLVEENRNNRYYRDWDDQAQSDPLADPIPATNPRYRRPGAPVPPLDPNQPSPAVQRAAQLMERANRRNRGGTIDNPPPRRGRSRADDYIEEPEQQSPLDGIMNTLNGLGRNLNIPGLPTIDASGVGNASKSIMVALLVVAFLLCSCLLLLTAWIISLFAG